MSGVWNIIHPTRVSYSKTIKNLLHSGQELYGTVIAHGVNDKCIKVRVSYRFWYPRLKVFMGRASTFMVHDEENYGVTGDKVVIKHTQKLSLNKYYYLRNIVVPHPRDNYYNGKEEPDQLMLELQGIRQELLKKQQSPQ